MQIDDLDAAQLQRDLPVHLGGIGVAVALGGVGVQQHFEAEHLTSHYGHGLEQTHRHKPGPIRVQGELQMTAEGFVDQPFRMLNSAQSAHSLSSIPTLHPHTYSDGYTLQSVIVV